MKKPVLILPALLFTLACTRPEVEAFRQKPAPVYVTMVLPTGVPNAQEVRQDYAAALRARLATRVTAVPEDVPPPAGAAELIVTVTRVEEGRRGGDPSPAAVGVATGVAVGTLGALSGNRYAAWDGLFWGLWTGTHVAAAQHHEASRLGYYPSRVQAQVTLRASGTPDANSRPLYEFDVDGHEVINAMDPLSRAASEDPARVREEEARAFARVIVWKLQDKFGWVNHSTPSFYRSDAKAD